MQIESSGKVFGVDIDPKAVELTKKNLVKFGISNVSVILGDAKEKISELPIPNAIFIGGTGGDTKEIVELCHTKLKKGGRIAVFFPITFGGYGQKYSLECFQGPDGMDGYGSRIVARTDKSDVSLETIVHSSGSFFTCFEVCFG